MKNATKLLTLLGVLLIVIIIAVIALATLSSDTATTTSDSSTETTLSAPDTKIDPVAEDMLPTATITMKDYAEPMVFTLYPNEAPQSVYNFIELANSGFYDGLTMHRLIEGFMIQGGDPDGTGSGGPGYSIQGEFSANGIDNPHTHQTGSLAMARSSDNDSGGSQFYICFADQPSLDGQYAVFGDMTSGEETLTALEQVETDANDAPLTPVVIESVTVDTKGIEYPEPTKL